MGSSGCLNGDEMRILRLCLEQAEGGKEKTTRSQLPWSLHRQCFHMFCWPEFATVMFKCQTQRRSGNEEGAVACWRSTVWKLKWPTHTDFSWCLGKKTYGQELNKARLFSNSAVDVKFALFFVFFISTTKQRLWQIWQMRSCSIFTCATPAAMWNPAILIRPCEPEADKQKTKTVGSLANAGGLKDWLSLKLACWRLFQGSQKALHLLSQRSWNALLDIDWQLNDVSTRSRHRLLCSGGCSSSHPQGVRPGKDAGWILCLTNWKVRWHIKPSRTTGPFPDGTPGCSEALDELR